MVCYGKNMNWEILHTGNFNDTQITEQWISDMVSTFRGRVPVVLGHSKGLGGFFGMQDGAPADGWIDAVDPRDNANGEPSLFGEVELLGAAKEGYEAKQYRNWSAGISMNDHGQYVLHHVALLGAVPPAIKGLEAQFSDSNGSAKQITFADGNGVLIMSQANENTETSENEETQNDDNQNETTDATQNADQPESASEEGVPEPTTDGVDPEATDETPNEATLSSISPDYSKSLDEENKRLRAELAEYRKREREGAIKSFSEVAKNNYPKAVIEAFKEDLKNVDSDLINKFSEFLGKALPKGTNLSQEVQTENTAPETSGRCPGLTA